MKAFVFILMAVLVLAARGQAKADDSSLSESAFGPSVSDKELFEILNLAHPGMEKVKSAVDAGDLEKAKHEFAGYLRHREKPVWRSDWRLRPKHDKRPQGVDTAEADRIMRHDLPSVSHYHQFGKKIDWTLNPINYREWPWQLNRHPFWVTLGQAYWATGEEKYAEEFVYQMTDWVKSCPVPKDSSGNSSETWRTIEAGIRTFNFWMESYHLFLTSPSFTDEAIVTMVKSFVEHARHLMKWPTRGNWLAMECDGLMHIGVMFPEFKESADWRKTATDRLYIELDKQVYPDGAQLELTTHYHQASLDNFVKAWEIARLNGIPMPEDYIAKIQKMYDYDLKVSMPGGILPGLNDADRIDIKGRMDKAFKFFPDRKDYQWVATDGKKGQKPAFESVALPFSGHLVMRSGWEPDDLYLLMDAGPFGLGHQHEDSLQFVIYAYGRYILVDPGNYAYDSSQWRKYVLSTRAHNTVMVDGQEQNCRSLPGETFVVSQPLPNKWASCDGFDYASGTYDYGYGPERSVKVDHSRHIFFVKPEYWIVTDFLTPSDDSSHRYESLFHLDVKDAKLDDRTKSVQTADKDAANLAIIPPKDDKLKARIVSGQEEPVVQGWIPRGLYKCEPIPTPVFEKEQSGPAVFSYIFYPTPAGKSHPVISVEPVKVVAEAGVQVSAIKAKFENGQVDLFIQAGKRMKMTFNGFEADALAAYIRMNGDEVVSAYLVDGLALYRDGKAIEAKTQAVKDLSRTKARHKF